MNVADPGVDLRLPLVFTVLSAVAVAALTRLPVALTALGLSLLLVCWHRIHPGRVFHRLAHVEGFLLVLLIALPLTTPGAAAFHLGPLRASVRGLELALLIAAKVNTVALLLLVWLGGVVPERLGRALAALGAPARFVQLMELTLRHLHTARDGLRRQSEAMRARAFHNHPGRPRLWPHVWRSHGHLVGGALLRAFDRAERVEEAMRMRGSGPLAHAPLPALGARGFARIGLLAAVALALVAVDRLP